MQPFVCILLLYSTILTWTGALVPHYNINLDLEPSERWKEVAIHFGQKVNRLAENALEQRLPSYMLPFARFLSLGAFRYIQEPYRSELAGFAKYGNVSLSNLVAMQLLYDATAFCTSIVCVDDGGKIWHARNLDYGLNLEEQKGLQSITIDTSLIQKGQVRVRATTFAGMLGFATAMRNGVFSLTLNERNKGHAYENLYAAFDMILKEKKLEPVFFVIRDTMMKASSYEEALETMKTTQMIAPCYIIIGGLTGNQGAVITRDRFKTLDVISLNATAGRWYLLQTNYDRWNPPPPDDDRRDPGKKAMNAMGRKNINLQNLFKVLFTHPVMNNSTVYSTVMSASQNITQSTIP